MNLTKLLQEEQELTMKLGESEIMIAKDIFSKWLEKVELPTYHTTASDGSSKVDATEIIRQLLIKLVSEV